MKHYFFDVGAFDGEESLAMEKIFQELKIVDYEIHCFEPSADSFDFLKSNVSKKSNSQKIKCHNLAISKENGKLKLYHSPGNNVGHSIFSTKCNVVTTSFEEVETVQFSDWLIKNIPDFQKSFNILKFNIEGAEFFLVKDLISNKLHENFHVICGDIDDVLKISELKLSTNEHYQNIKKLKTIVFPFSAQAGKITLEMEEQMKIAINQNNDSA